MSLAGLALWSIVTLNGAAQAAPLPCEAAGYQRSVYESAKRAGWPPGRVGGPDRALLTLASCLDHPDPDIREGLAVHGLVTLLRSGSVSPETVRTLRSNILARLQGPPDRLGFRHPFAARALSEVARADRIDNLFSPEERGALIAATAAYLHTVTDYRGFDEKEGWRHGSAYGADLAMQLALNPHIAPGALAPLPGAVLAQVTPAEHFYIYREPERLARAAVFLAGRGAAPEEGWNGAFAGLAEPPGDDGWTGALQRQQGWARRHNAAAFLRTVALTAETSRNENIRALADPARAALATLP